MTAAEAYTQAARMGVSLLVLVPGIYAATWIDSKLGADLQARVGPSRTGAGGWLQPLADFLSLLQKYRPGSKGGHGPTLWWVQGLPLFALVALTPMGSLVPPLDTPMAVLFSLVMAICFSWAGLLLSWRAGLVESRFAAFRQTALGVAGLPPALLAVLQAGLVVGGLSWSKMESGQSWAPWSWLALQSPFTMVSALVFISSGLLLFSVPPFNPGNLGLQWVVASYPGESGIRLLWVRFSQRVANFCWTLMAAHIFFGGGALPGALGDSLHAAALSVAIGALKALCILAGVSVLGRTLPSVRADQAHDFAWRVLSPLALLSLLGTRIFSGGLG